MTQSSGTRGILSSKIHEPKKAFKSLWEVYIEGANGYMTMVNE